MTDTAPPAGGPPFKDLDDLLAAAGESAPRDKHEMAVRWLNHEAGLAGLADDLEDLEWPGRNILIDELIKWGVLAPAARADLVAELERRDRGDPANMMN